MEHTYQRALIAAAEQTQKEVPSRVITYLASAWEKAQHVKYSMLGELLQDFSDPELNGYTCTASQTALKNLDDIIIADGTDPAFYLRDDGRYPIPMTEEEQQSAERKTMEHILSCLALQHDSGDGSAQSYIHNNYATVRAMLRAATHATTHQQEQAVYTEDIGKRIEDEFKLLF